MNNNDMYKYSNFLTNKLRSKKLLNKIQICNLWHIKVFKQLVHHFGLATPIDSASIKQPMHQLD